MITEWMCASAILEFRIVQALGASMRRRSNMLDVLTAEYTVGRRNGACPPRGVDRAPRLREPRGAAGGRASSGYDAGPTPGAEGRAPADRRAGTDPRADSRRHGRPEAHGGTRGHREPHHARMGAPRCSCN